MKDLRQDPEMRRTAYADIGILTIQDGYPRYSKAITDEVDRDLAEHYGFTEGELDFTIDYDIKCRTGKDDEEEDE